MRRRIMTSHRMAQSSLRPISGMAARSINPAHGRDASGAIAAV
jgi:hypothetical protein